jgi:hypothetical protein
MFIAGPYGKKMDELERWARETKIEGEEGQDSDESQRWWEGTCSWRGAVALAIAIAAAATATARAVSTDKKLTGCQRAAGKRQEGSRMIPA